MTWKLDEDGAYVLFAEGVEARGTRAAEKPQRLFPDGKPYAVDNLPGLTSVTIRPGTNGRWGRRQHDDGDHERIRFAAAAVHDAHGLGPRLTRPPVAGFPCATGA